jgi:SAM-dependent methyltransferase
MIATANKAAAVNPNISKICTFEGIYPHPLTNHFLKRTVIDASQLTNYPALQNASFDKVFSNAAMHWILRPESRREAFFQGVRKALKPGGTFVFEMGGMGNVAEMRSTLLSVISKRVGIEKAREVDPWFFPDEVWMSKMLEETVGGWKVERIEREYRPTKADEGGVQGWVKLMGKQFFDAVEDSVEREKCEKEVGEVLKTVCESPGGGEWIGYVRLRAAVRKI